MSVERRSADVVIVGAGISGWILAALLANTELSVVVLEQQYQRPRDSSFAGVVTNSDFDALGLGRPSGAALRALQSVVDVLLQDGAVLSKQEVAGAFSIRHDDLLAWLRSIALDGGVEFERAMTMTEWRWGGGAVAGVVAGPDATAWDARVVVLGDESDPRLAEEPGLRPEWTPVQLMHTAGQRFGRRNAWRNGDRVATHSGGTFHDVAVTVSGRTTWGQTGFGTLIPCGDTSTLTVAMLLEDEMTSSRHISDVLEEVRGHPTIAAEIEGLEPEAFVTEVVPIGGVSEPHRLSGDGVLVLGDVVGLTHPLNRDGLSSNVDVAKHAAAAIVEVSRAGNFSAIGLSRFDERVRELVIELLRGRAAAASISADVAWTVSSRFDPLRSVASPFRSAQFSKSVQRQVGQRPVSLRKRLTEFGQRIRLGD